MRSRPAQILIAHQSTIPNYRVRFYELLEQCRPKDWEFRVVCDNRRQYIDGHGTDNAEFGFPTAELPLSQIKLWGGRSLKWQNLLQQASNVDALIIDTTISNLGYPVAALLRKKNIKLGFWGHTKNLNTGRNSLVINAVKSRYLQTGDHFFAYTEKQTTSAQDLGFSKNDITVLNNTVDIQAHRNRFQLKAGERPELRQKFGFKPDENVVLFVGRLLIGRRIDFLLESLCPLLKADQFKLIIAGDGPELPRVLELQKQLPQGKLLIAGAIHNAEKLADYYIASDLFVLPGMVGLSPVEAICYNLPILAFDLNCHGPEIEYLNSANSVILPACTSASEFTHYLKQAFGRREPANKSNIAFQSIAHLTIENMVENFIGGVSKLLSN